MKVKSLILVLPFMAICMSMSCRKQGIPSAPKELATDSVGCLLKPDSLVECKIAVDYPVGKDSFSANVRNYIGMELYKTYLPLVNDEEKVEKEYPRYSGSLGDGQTVVDYYGKGTVRFLHEQCDEIRKVGMDSPGMAFDMAIRKIDENDRYVTYKSTSYIFLGGAHGSSTEYAVNIVKPSGTVLADVIDTVKLKSMQPLLRKYIVKYLHECGDKSVTIQSLNDILFIENGMVPIPSHTPYLAADGVHFIYQQYEIGPYAMGMVSFTIPYNEIKPYLTKEAYDVIVWNECK